MDTVTMEDLKEKVFDTIEAKINPILLEHNGWIDLEDIVDGIVYVRFSGACHGCGAIYNTLDSVIKPALMKEFPEITDVLIEDGVSDDTLDLVMQMLQSHDGDK